MFFDGVGDDNRKKQQDVRPNAPRSECPMSLSDPPLRLSETDGGSALSTRRSMFRRTSTALTAWGLGGLLAGAERRTQGAPPEFPGLILRSRRPLDLETPVT